MGKDSLAKAKFKSKKAKVCFFEKLRQASIHYPPKN